MMKYPHQVLEKKWAEMHPGFHMVACASGSAALHLGLQSLSSCEGLEVWIPNYTMVACARAAVMTRMKIKLVPCDRTRGVMLHSAVGEMLEESKPNVFMIVHPYGRKSGSYNLNPPEHLVNLGRYPTITIEDLSQAHGVQPNRSTEVACWSFYKNKIVGGYEGGIVGFRNEVLAGIAKRLRNLGFAADQSYHHAPYGWNHRLSDIHAEAILPSMERMEENLLLRADICHMYDALLKDVVDLRPRRQSCWVYDLVLPQGINREFVVSALRSLGVEARHGMTTMALQDEFWDPREFLHRNDAFYKRIMTLPIDPRMTVGDVKYCVEMFKKCIASSDMMP